MNLIIIGNMFSFCAAIFTVLASMGKTREQIYIRQFIQCALLGIASVFFQSWSGLVTMTLNCTRNALLLKNKFTKLMCVLYIILILLFGQYFNNRGPIGLIPVYCSILYTIISYFLKNPIPIKINIITNLILWMIYELYIYDFSSAVTDVFTIGLTIVSIYRIKKEENAKNAA